MGIHLEALGGGAHYRDYRPGDVTFGAWRTDGHFVTKPERGVLFVYWQLTDPWTPAVPERPIGPLGIGLLKPRYRRPYMQTPRRFHW